eukprot:g2429.t1
MAGPAANVLLLVHSALSLTCNESPLAALPFCDSTLSVKARVADLLPRLNQTEKIQQMGMVASAVERLGMQEYNFGGEALHGVWANCVKDNVTTPIHNATGRKICPTQFPAPVTMSQAYDRDLWARMADASSAEARGLYHSNLVRHPQHGGFGTPCSRSLEGCLGLSYYTPNVNLARDPRWGRIEETPGEDPVVNAEYVRAFTRGFQSGVGQRGGGEAEPAPYYLRASVTVKHYLAYSLEVDLEKTPPAIWCGSVLNEGGVCALPNDRHSFNANVSAQDMEESYLPVFRAAVEAGAAAIMCSYNAINGEPACTNKPLIAGTLRARFGFEGVLATDCGALDDATVRHQRYASNADTATAAVSAGVDSNCGSVFVDALPAALANGTLTSAQLDESVARLLNLRFRLGLFDATGPAPGRALPVSSLRRRPLPRWMGAGIETVDTTAHRALALRAAREGIVLLQNGVVGAGAKLPLSPASQRTIAMLGPNANASMNLLSGYHGNAPLLVSPLHAMRAKWGGAARVRYHVGCNVSDLDPSAPHVAASVAAAVRVAAAADVDTIVIGLGLCGDNYGGGPPTEDPTCFNIDESETIDRASLALPGAQMSLFRAVLALGKPVVVFTMNAGPVALEEIQRSGVPIVAAGYGGEYGGQALADVLDGSYNPGGALTTTVYPAHFTRQSSFRDMRMRPAGTSSPGRTYRFLDESAVKPLWRFGFGLSYTTFSVAFAAVPSPAASGPAFAAREETAWTVRLRNTGPVAGSVVVACYVAAVQQAAVRAPPTRSLFDFARAEDLAPGAARTLQFELPASRRAVVDEAGRVLNPAGTYAVQCEAGGVVKTKVVRIMVA